MAEERKAEIELLHSRPGTPLVLWCSHRNFEQPGHMMECIEAATGSDAYSLAVFYAEDWNKDYAPWPAANPVDGRTFGGGGVSTEKRLTEAMEELRRTQDITQVILCGYSLAGLFSLWMGLRCSWVDGIICSSGSLWYEGFAEYLRSVTLPCDKRIYLSLGGKEKKVSHPVMQTIEERTREAEKILKAKEKVTAVRFELNAGGHFADSCKRMAGGVKWMIK